jgi:hypothetical protein
MPDAIDYHSISLDLKENSVIPDSQAKIWSDVRQALYVPFQIVLQLLNLCQQPHLISNTELFQVLNGSWFEFKFVHGVRYHFQVCRVVCRENTRRSSNQKANVAQLRET